MPIAAIVLAAGASTRFGQAKQLAIFREKSLVRRAVDAAADARCEPIVVVTGDKSDEIEAELKATSATLARNPSWREGIASSLRAGIEQLRTENVSAVVLLTCDQPLVDEAVIRSLIELATASAKPIVASAYSGTIGIPALFDRSCFDDLLALRGDHGAKSLIMSRPHDVATINFPGGAIDIDTPEDFARMNGR